MGHIYYNGATPAWPIDQLYTYGRTMGDPGATHGLAIDYTSVPMEDTWVDHIPMGGPWTTHERPVGYPREVMSDLGDP